MQGFSVHSSKKTGHSTVFSADWAKEADVQRRKKAVGRKVYMGLLGINELHELEKRFCWFGGVKRRWIGSNSYIEHIESHKKTYVVPIVSYVHMC